MRPRLLSSFLLFHFLVVQKVYADTFIVTSNADSGPGSFREAITNANANGSTLYDTISFDMPGTTEAARTIDLQTELPPLSSRIVVDGSTQAGATLGISTAKVILFLNHYTSVPFTYLFVQNATEVSIFGICFKYFDDPVTGGGEHYAIRFRNSSEIKIGAPGKGNLFSSVRIALTNSFWISVNDSISNLVIQSNVIGMSTGGSMSGGGLVDFMFARNVTIGGSQQNEGNVFLNAVLIAQSVFPNPSFFVRIENNKFNFDGTRYYGREAFVDLVGNSIDDTSVFRSLILNNYFNGDNYLHGLLLRNINHKVKIQGNKFGTDERGTDCRGYRNHIQTMWCQYVLIGGHLPEEQNLIMADIYVGSDKTHIVQNKISGRIDNKVYVPGDPFIKIVTYDNNLITGVANPHAKIQLYEHVCPGNGCTLKSYVAAVDADNNGNWQFPYTDAMPNLTATATRSDSSTSEFAEPSFDHYSQRIIQNATCGKSNGSITGIKVFSGTHIRWYDSYTMNLISTDTNLVNVPAGSYVFTVSNGKNGCRYGVNFTIDDIQPPTSLNPSPYIIDATCGKSNGSITTYNFSYGSKWMNANYDSVGTGYYLNNAMTGTYYLKVWIQYDTSCNKTYGPFMIKNDSGPTLNVNTVRITPATCNEANGKIENIGMSNVIGTPYVQWLDSLNNQVGSTISLVNVSAGKYRLKFKDHGTCDTIITPYFVIPSKGTITIDESNIEIKPAGCTIDNGSIQNISVTGAETFQWKNLSSGSAAGNSEDIFTLDPGTYQLNVANSLGCNLTSSVITVPRAQFAGISPQQAIFENGSCGESNGTIQVSGFSNETALLSHRWVNRSTNQVIGTGLSITGLGPAIYDLVAVDTNGCEQTIFTQPIIVNPKPLLNTMDVVITDDQCALQKGNISGIKINGLQGPTTYTWVNSGNGVVGNSPELVNIGPGQYRLRVEDKGNCIIETEVFSVNNDNNAGTMPLYDDVMIPRNTETSLTVKNFQQGTYILYHDAAATQVIHQNTTGVFNTGILSSDKDFYVRHITGSCSSAVVKIKVSLVDKSSFAIPTAFTPNNDGLNDKLTLKVIGHIEVEYFRVYNRNGELVFSTKTINNGWDGSLKGIEQPSGAYVWMARGKDITGKSIAHQGSFVLIR